MYLQHYNLSSKPFTLLPDPAFLYLGKQHALAYAMLQYGLLNDSGGFIVITGEVGSGKTTLIRRILADANDAAILGLISYTHSEFGELLQWVLMSLNLEYKNKSKAELYQDFAEYIRAQKRLGKRVVLVIDEAHNLSPATLEEIRMLANLNTEQGQVLQLIISGQPELLENLRRPELHQFAQRVTIQYHLEALIKQECFDYIRHRLAVAGATTDIFDESALLLIAYYSRGIPRVINTLCDLSLLYGFAEQTGTIDDKIVRKVIRDRKIGGLFMDLEEENTATLSSIKGGI